MKLSIILSQLSTGMAGTISIFVLTLVFSLPLGLLIAFGRMSKNRIVSGIFRLYISLMRGTPLMLQLMVVYFGPFYLFGMNIGKWRFPAIITGFALNYGAYFAEIYRSGIVSMDRGQYEAAKLLGYSKGQTFVRIILPQVVKRILPAITNEVITLVKDTSLAFSISYVEMFTIAKQIAAAKTTMVPFVAAGIFYYIFNFVVAWVMELLERNFLLSLTKEESGKRYDLSGNEPCKKELWGSRSVKRYFPQSRRGRGALDHRPVGIGKIDVAAVCSDAGDDGWR